MRRHAVAVAVATLLMLIVPLTDTTRHAQYALTIKRYSLLIFVTDLLSVTF